MIIREGMDISRTHLNVYNMCHSYEVMQEYAKPLLQASSSELDKRENNRLPR